MIFKMLVSVVLHLYKTNKNRTAEQLLLLYNNVSDTVKVDILQQDALLSDLVVITTT